jgi:hypothetical protein
LRGFLLPFFGGFVMETSAGSSLSHGWRQDVNVAALGYFRTDDETTRRILAMISVPSDVNPTIFDPCAGEGIAIAAVQGHCGGTSYAIEYDQQRYIELAQCVDVPVHGDAISEFYGSGKWASILWFNPPYGSTTVVRASGEESIRLEQQFWERQSDRLQRDGLLVCIVPDYLFRDSPSMARMLSHYLGDGQPWGVWRAATNQFKQLVIIGNRAQNSFNRNTLVEETLLAISSGNADVPPLPVHPAKQFTVPQGIHPGTFEVHSLTQTAVESMLAKIDDTGFLAEIDQALTPPSARARQRSIMPLRDGHIPAVLASGLLDGYVEDEDGRFLVKGIARRTVTERNVLAKGEHIISKMVSIHRAETIVFAWDVDSLELRRIA